MILTTAFSLVVRIRVGPLSASYYPVLPPETPPTTIRMVAGAEYERVRELEKRGLFDFELVCPNPLPTAAVVVVDPFSSGSILAARVLQCRFRLVMVFSEVGGGL